MASEPFFPSTPFVGFFFSQPPRSLGQCFETVRTILKRYGFFNKMNVQLDDTLQSSFETHNTFAMTYHPDFLPLSFRVPGIVESYSYQGLSGISIISERCARMNRIWAYKAATQWNRSPQYITACFSLRDSMLSLLQYSWTLLLIKARHWDKAQAKISQAQHFSGALNSLGAVRKYRVADRTSNRLRSIRLIKARYMSVVLK